MTLPPPPPLDPGTNALFLDLDGTLAPIADDPHAVAVPKPTQATLARLLPAMEGRLAVVSGRDLASLDRFLPGLAIALAGVHGLDRRLPDGRRATTPPSPGLATATQAARDFAELHAGVLVEDKALATAIHYRQAPDRESAVLDLARDLAQKHDLPLQPGKMVVELKGARCDKGRAIAAFMAEPPFAGHTPIFVGDDLTDEHGFEVAAAQGGYGILVGAPRDTAARYHLADEPAVARWLAAALAPA